MGSAVAGLLLLLILVFSVGMLSGPPRRRSRSRNEGRVPTGIPVPTSLEGPNPVAAKQAASGDQKKSFEGDASLVAANDVNVAAKGKNSK